MTQHRQTLAQTRRSNGLAFRIVRAALSFLARGYFHLDVHGLHHIPRQGGAIIAANHPSVLDGVFLLVVSPRPVHFLVAEEYYNHPFLKPLFQALGNIAVYRTKTHNGEALRMAIEALGRGEVVGIFPEGTTNFRGTMQHMKQGVALLALRTGCPVVPVGISGSREVFPHDAKIPLPHLVQLHVEAPITFSKTAFEQIPEDQILFVQEQIRQRILQLTEVAQTSPHEGPVHRMGWLKWVGVVTAALIIVPLARFLTLTSRRWRGNQWPWAERVLLE